MPATTAANHWPRLSLSHGPERDARVRRLLDMHPATAAMLVGLRWFPSKDKALKRLRTLTRRGAVRLVGTIARTGTGRPEHVYCGWRLKPDQLLHEVELTEVCLRLHAARILRGPHVRDRARSPDAELWINGDYYALELDRGTTGAARIEQERFPKYASSPHLCLWVCPTAARRETLRARAAGVRRTALFATMQDALRDPHAAIWVDHDGRRAALPRQADVASKPSPEVA